MKCTIIAQKIAQESRGKSRKKLSFPILLRVSRDLDITAFVLLAPRLAFLGPFFLDIVKTALLALIQLLIFLLDYFDHVF